MKKLFVLFAIISMLFTAKLVADPDPYQDWIWVGAGWVYVGDDGDDPGDPPVAPPIKL